MNSYDLSRTFFNYSFENPEKINTNHIAIYFFAIEHCNRLGWKDKFGFPSQMVMEAVGIKNWRTYSKHLNDLVEYGFIKMIEKSKNQYSSNIIAIVKNTKATTKALDKALQKHHTKHIQSIVSIDKQETSKQETNIYINFLKNNYTSIYEQMIMNLTIKDKDAFLDFFENKCVLEDIPMDFHKIKARFNILKSNWGKGEPKEDLSRHEAPDMDWLRGWEEKS